LRGEESDRISGFSGWTVIREDGEKGEICLSLEVHPSLPVPDILPAFFRHKTAYINKQKARKFSPPRFCLFVLFFFFLFEYFHDE
jgi:hypothetical protein